MTIKFLEEDRILRWVALVGMVAIGIALLAGFSNPSGLNVANLTVWGIAILCDTTASVLAMLLWRSFGEGEILRRIWGRLTLGLLLWAIATAIWAVYDVTLGPATPYPSISDLIYLVGYVPLISALLCRYHSLRMTPSQGKRLVVYVVLGLLVVMPAIVVWPLATSSAPASRFVLVFDGLFILASLLALLGALLNLLVLSRGALASPWRVIVAGFLAISIADVLSSNMLSQTILTDIAPYYLLSQAGNVYLAASVTYTFGIFLQARLQQIV